MGSKKSLSSQASFRMILLTLMVFQNSSVVLVGRHTRSSVSKSDMYVVNHLILVCEFLKLVLSAILEHIVTDGQLMKSVKENIIDNPLDFLRTLVPSLLYLVQNSLLYIALSNLSAPLFQVTYQTKVLTTALISVIMLNRRYSLKQWICLFFLGIGVAIVLLGEGSAKISSEENADPKSVVEKVEAEVVEPDEPAQSLFAGLFAVFIACISSALAGVYFEKVLKKSTKNETGKERPPVSLWMRNIQLAFFSVIIAFVQFLMLKGADLEKPFLYGFTAEVWILVILQAGGGLLVAAVIKYADNVLKGLATGVSVVVSTACAVIFFGTTLGVQFVCGASIILSSVYLFTNDIPSCLTRKRKGGEKENEMKPLTLPR
eukprot:CAMPEP_0185724054 /NCGR_PEP_ID=MMETSP1171-20130828/657_1 /TAXON_ID=374046 /ORGANISM="Helicotheca tamensis, Strain CCMP826" /LENGTH=373 /DNA_ID=CAMNT_0028391829 /DNA_START=203 /DNA_END=1324 /DNA_ORIENTATION=+